jgi:hypothetical protein
MSFKGNHENQLLKFTQEVSAVAGKYGNQPRKSTKSQNLLFNQEDLNLSSDITLIPHHTRISTAQYIFCQLGF